MHSFIHQFYHLLLFLFEFFLSQGMNYLHGSIIGSHGRLNTRCVIIDKKWTCGISDYGLHCIRFPKPDMTANMEAVGNVTN